MNNTITVAIACLDRNGNPRIATVSMEVSERDYQQGFYLEHAKELAENQGYQSPFICFGPEDMSELTKLEAENSVTSLPIVDSPSQLDTYIRSNNS